MRNKIDEERYSVAIMNVNLVEEVEDLLSFENDETCLEQFQLYAIDQKLFTLEGTNCTDLFYLFVKIFPLTFLRDFKKTRQWLVEKSFQTFDPISTKVLQQFYQDLLNC